MRWVYLAVAGALAVAVVVLANRSGAPEPRAAPQAIVKSATGSFRPSRSPAGMPTFSISSARPGDSGAGRVTVVNRGTRRGYFYLSQQRLTDVVGPGGGALSARLRVTVRDVTSPGAPIRVYSGLLAAMDARPLGFIAPGAARRYSFETVLRGGVAPRSARSSTSVRYVWSALGDSPRRDRRPPRMRVSIPNVQPLVQRSRLMVRARCDEQCRIGVLGRVLTGPREAPTLPIANRPAPTGRPVELAIGIPRSMRLPVRWALLETRAASIALKLTARDEAGNLSVVKRTVRLRPRLGRSARVDADRRR